MVGSLLCKKMFDSLQVGPMGHQGFRAFYDTQLVDSSCHVFPPKNLNLLTDGWSFSFRRVFGWRIRLVLVQRALMDWLGFWDHSGGWVLSPRGLRFGNLGFKPSNSSETEFSSFLMGFTWFYLYILM